jgi:hypothetical protein
VEGENYNMKHFISLSAALLAVAATGFGCYSEHRQGTRVYEPAGAQVEVYSGPSYGVYGDRERQRLERERWNEAHPRGYYYEKNRGNVRRDYDGRNWEEERERQYQRERFQR